LSNNVQVFLGL